MPDLKGRKFRIGVNDAHPFIFLYKTPIDGTEAKILLTLSQYLNFTYEWVENKWYRLFDSIVSNKTDFGIFNMFITHERAEQVTFSYPYIIDLVTFTSPQPMVQSNAMNLIQPFDIWIWISIVLSSILMFGLSVVLVRNETNIRWIIVSILMRQQFHLVPNIRLLVSGWLLAGVVFTSSYAGVIYYITATPLEVGRIDTIQELSLAQKEGKITVLGLKGGLHYKMMKSLSSGISQEIGSAMKGVNSTKIAIDLLKSSRSYALLLTKEKLTYMLHYYQIKSHYIPDDSNMDSVFAINLIGIPMNKHFPYKTQFNRFISDAIKGGLIKYWRHKFYQKTFFNYHVHFKLNQVKRRELSQLCIEQFNFIYLILTFGFITSTILVFIELLVKRCRSL